MATTDPTPTPDRDRGGIVLTLDWLIEREACAEGREWFAAHYPEGVESTEAEGFVDALLETSGGWADWLVRRTPLQAEYDRRETTLWAEYEQQREVLQAEYRRQTVVTWAEYDRREAPLRAEYDRNLAAVCRAFLCQWLATPTEEGR